MGKQQISDLEKQIGEIKDEPNQKEIDAEATRLLKEAAEARKAGKNK